MSRPQDSRITTEIKSADAEKVAKAFEIHDGLEARARKREAEARLDESQMAGRASFPYGRRNGITEILRLRHGLFCNTEQAPVFFEIVLPFIVDAAVRDNKSTYHAAVNWAERYVPKLAGELGRPKIHDMVDALLEIRRQPWPERMSKDGRTYLSWLPAMEEIVQKLQLRWEEVVESGKLGGWGSINEPTTEQRLAHDRKRKDRKRRAADKLLRSEMTKMKEAEALAQELGTSERTIRRWRDDKKIDMEKKIAERRLKLSQASPNYALAA